MSQMRYESDAIIRYCYKPDAPNEPNAKDNAKFGKKRNTLPNQSESVVQVWSFWKAGMVI
jgi:hypothetical protein